MEVSQNGSTSKSSIVMWLSITNHPFWGTWMYVNPYKTLYITNNNVSSNQSYGTAIHQPLQPPWLPCSQRSATLWARRKSPWSRFTQRNDSGGGGFLPWFSPRKNETKPLVNALLELFFLGGRWTSRNAINLSYDLNILNRVTASNSNVRQRVQGLLVCFTAWWRDKTKAIGIEWNR